MRTTYPRVVVSDYQWIRRLEPGRVDRRTGCVLFCREPGVRGRCVNADDAALVTTDERGSPVGKIRLVHDVREGTGALRCRRTDRPGVPHRPGSTPLLGSQA
ncbi:hypothetical protein ACFYT7_21010 [Streptomyces sp. NPDC004041]|uniref:hypothetical protein n=1 Tax=Streptomyces sp. NPDC004041 TaxID=3364688 RepID=UPI00368F2B40